MSENIFWKLEILNYLLHRIILELQIHSFLSTFTWDCRSSFQPNKSFAKTTLKVICVRVAKGCHGLPWRGPKRSPGPVFEPMTPRAIKKVCQKLCQWAKTTFLFGDKLFLQLIWHLHFLFSMMFQKKSSNLLKKSSFISRINYSFWLHKVSRVSSAAPPARCTRMGQVRQPIQRRAVAAAGFYFAKSR